jgi:hypothetical protein
VDQEQEAKKAEAQKRKEAQDDEEAQDAFLINIEQLKQLFVIGIFLFIYYNNE